MSIYRKQTRISPEYVLLGFLYQSPGYGYELHRRLLAEFGFIWHVSQSQSYNILQRLLSQGYIKATAVPQEKLPTRQLLQITMSGMERFNSWLNTPTDCSVHAIRVEFITRMYFMKQYQPDHVIESIRIQTNEVKKGLHSLKELRSNLPADQLFNCLALELRISLLGSMIHWLDECREKFSSERLN